MRLEAGKRFGVAGSGVAIDAAMHAGVIRADVAAGETAASLASRRGTERMKSFGKQFRQQLRIHAMRLLNPINA